MISDEDNLHSKYKIMYDREDGEWKFCNKEMIDIGKFSWVVISSFNTKEDAVKAMKEELASRSLT